MENCYSIHVTNRKLAINVTNVSVPGSWARLVQERSLIDPDFRERSLTKRLVPARALSFLGSKKLRSQQL